MENNIFTQQCEFIDFWDNQYKNYEGTSKKCRLNFFRILNQEICNFYYRYIDHNILQLQRAYFFAFWIGSFYLKNADCISEIEIILNFSNLYRPFGKITQMINSKVKKIIIEADAEESRIIFEKMHKFKKEYAIFESKINKIIKFFRICKRKKMLKLYSIAISSMRSIFPDDIILNIIKYLKSDNDYQIFYLQYKNDIDLIMQHCGLNKKKLKYTIDIYDYNNKDVESSIIEIANNFSNEFINSLLGI